MYEIYRTHVFEKDVKKLRKDKNLMTMLFKKIEKIQKHPDFGKPLKQRLSGFRSVRVGGKHRLIYKSDHGKKRITLVCFGPRDIVYDYFVRIYM